MSIIACEVPTLSVLDRRLIEKAFFHDAYRAPLSRPRASVVEVFFAIFGHHPMWMKFVLVLRNWLASWFGLEVPTAAEIMRPQIKARYHVGEKVGPWPIFHLSEIELIAGRNNTHLDFRLSVLKETSGVISTAVVSANMHLTRAEVFRQLMSDAHEVSVFPETAEQASESARLAVSRIAFDSGSFRRTTRRGIIRCAIHPT